MNVNKKEIFLFSIFGAMGLFLIYLAFNILIHDNLLNDDLEKISATITTMTDYTTDRGEASHKVYIDYTYEGLQHHNVPLGYYSAGMQEGKTITVYLDKTNPGTFKGMADMFLFPIFVFLFGAVFFSVGFIPIFKKVKKANFAKKLRKNGKVLHAVVDQVSWNTTYSINGENPAFVICRYLNPNTNNVLTFKSDDLWLDASFYFPIGSQIDVFVKEGDYTVYHVNVEDRIAAVDSEFVK